MNKREQKKFERALASFAQAAGFDAEQLKEEVNVAALYSEEDDFYEGQSVINFYKYRIKPILEGKKPGETEAKFKARKDDWELAYKEWKIRICEGCNSEFAYALTYEGVKYCSLLCLDKALSEIGLSVTRGRDITMRWGLQHHPAIVPSSAFQSLKETYCNDAAISFAE